MAEEITSIGVGVDTSGIDRGIRSLESLAAQGPKVEKALKGVESAASSASKSAGDLGKGSAKGIQDLGNEAPKAAKGLNDLADGAKKAKKELEGVDGEAKSAKDGIAQLGSAASGVQGSFNAAALGVQAFMGLQIVGWAKDASVAIYQASAAAERLKIGLDFASARGSAAEIEYLRRTTYDLGLQFSSTAQAYQQFQAAARGTSIEGEKARLVFESISKASAVMGLTADQSAGALLALQQMVSKGTVQAEELRGQLGERLPGAFQIAARSMGVTTAALGKMLENGEVLAEDFLPKFAAELTKSLGDAPEKAAERLDATINRTGDAWERLKQNIGDSGVSSFMSGQLNILADAMANFNNRIEASRAAGEGFAGQMLAGAAAAAQFINPVNAIGYSALEAGNQLKEAETRLEELKESGAKTSSNLMLREAYRDAERLVNKLREAKKAQDDLAANRAAEQIVGDPYSDGAQYQAYLDNRKAVEASEKAVLEIMQRRSGVTKQNTKDIEDLGKALALGTISEANYRKEVTAINLEISKRSGTFKTTTEGANQQESAYANLAKRANEYVKSMQLEISQGSKLSQSQKLQLDLENLLVSSKGKLSKAQVVGIQASINEAKGLERQANAVKQAVKAYQDYVDLQDELSADYVKQSKAREQLWLSMDKSVRALEDETKMLELEEQMIGQTNAARDIAIEKLKIELELREQIEAINANEGLDEAGRVRDRAKARETAIKKIALAERKVAVAEWDKTSQMIGDTLSDYIMGGGRDAATYLKRLFSNLVLQPIVQTVVSGALGAVGLGGASTGGVGGLMSNISSINNLGNLFSGGLASSLGGMIGSLGSALGSTALTSFATGMKGASLAAGLAGPTTAGASGAMGLGASFGAALPWIGGALAIGSLLKGAFSGESRTGSQFGVAYNGQVTNNRRGQTYYNAGQNYRNPNGVGDALENGRAYWLEGADPSAADASIAKAVEVTAAGIDDLFKLLGSEARLNGFWAGLETSGKGRGGVMSGGMLGNGTIFGESGQGDNYAGTLYEKFSSTSPDFEQALKDFELDLKQVTLQALQSADDLPDSIKKMLDGVETELLDNDAVDALLVKIQGIAIGAAALGNALDLMDLSLPAGNIIDFTAALSEFNGGLENSLNLLGGFYNAFYSEEERMRTAAEQMKKALAAIDINIDPAMGEEAKKQYRDAVNAALEAGDAELYAKLLEMAGSFASIADYAAKSVEAAAEAARKAAEEAQKANLDAAWANYEAAVNRERDLLQSRVDEVSKSISTLSNLGNVLKNNANDLYSSVTGTSQQRGIEGMLYIESALAAARNGADMTSFTGLIDSVSAARSGLSSATYSSQFERDREALVLAGQLSELGELTDIQLSVEEKQLKSLSEQIELLDKNLEYWRAQLDGTAKLIDVNLSVEQALERLIAAMTVSEEISDVLVKDPLANGGGASFGPGSYEPVAASPYATSEARIARAAQGDSVAYAEALELKRVMHQYDGTGDLAGLMSATIAAGGTALDVAREYGYDLAQLEDALKKAGIPAFDVGTNYVPRDTLAFVHEGEAIIPKAFNPYANGSGGTLDQSSVVRELQELRRELSELRATSAQTASNTSGLPQMSDQFDTVASNGFIRVKEETF